MCVASRGSAWYSRVTVTNCRYCNDEILFAWHADWNKWVPIEPESITGDEQITEDERGVMYERYHRKHLCQRGKFRSSREKWGAAGAASSESKPPPRTPPRASKPSPPPSRTGSWAHATLFVTSDAPAEVIRAAYKALAMLYHPDLGGDPERMVDLNRAYETLTQKT
jgi:DnaJ domain